MARKEDLLFVGEQWENYDIPKDKKWLKKYFNTNLQEMYIKYFLLFGDSKNFNDHTGVRCRKHWLAKLEKKRIALQSAHIEAKKNMDMSLLALIESGQYKIDNL